MVIEGSQPLDVPQILGQITIGQNGNLYIAARMPVPYDPVTLKLGELPETLHWVQVPAPASGEALRVLIAQLHATTKGSVVL